MPARNWQQNYATNPVTSLLGTDVLCAARGTADVGFILSTMVPLTTKGDLFTYGTQFARLGVGANGTYLTADSAQANGIKWANISASDITGVLGLANGGTNANLAASASLGGIVYSTATAFGILGATDAHQRIVMSVAGGAPQWSVATYPASTSANQILYSPTNNVIDAIAAGSQGVMVSSPTSVPGWTFAPTNNSGYLLMSTQDAAPAFSNYTFPTDANLGDIIYGATIGVFTTLGGNTTTTKKVLTQTGTGTVPTAPLWDTISGSDITGNALTRTNDTNVTLTLGGSPTTALLNAASLTLGWTGLLAGTRGGTGVNNGASTLTYGGNVTFSGAFTFTGTVTGNTSVTFPTSGTLATTSQIPTGAALTKTDDTNVTLSLGGSPSTALVNATSLTLGWTGLLSGTRGGTGVNNGSNTITCAGNLNFANSFTTSGNFAVTQTYTGSTNVTFPTSGTLATTSQIPSGAALTKTDDTNVTLTLGGSPTTALVNAASLTLGWAGQLGVTRGGTGLSGTTVNQILYSSATNTIAGLTTGNNGVLITSAGGVPSISSTLPTAVQGNITSTGTLGNQLNTTRACFHAYYAAGNQNFSKSVETQVAYDTERFDQGNNFASNTFTAPVTGKYVFNVNMGIVATNAATEFYCYLLASGLTYFLQECDPTYAGSAFGFSASIIVAMTAGDTAIVKTFASGGTGTYSIFSGNGGPSFSGYLLC
jgi:hypothetical protein